MILSTYITPSGAYRLAKVSADKTLLIDLQAAHKGMFGEEIAAFESMQALIEAGDEGLKIACQIHESLAAVKAHCQPLDSVSLASPLPIPMQIRDFSVFEQHLRQAAVGVTRLRNTRLGDDSPLPCANDIPLPEAFLKQPVYYKANRFNVIGHEQDVIWPSHSQRLDYELELGIVLGRTGRDISEKEAREYIFGYTIFNDFSARDAQEFEMTAPFGPAKGKDFDTGNVIGPWIVTRDELPDPYKLRMTARVNGELWSEGSSCDMVHSFEKMIAHVSRDETLYAGEIFGSGTIGGGCGLEIDRWLSEGDTVELEVEGIGLLRNRVVQGCREVG